MHGAGVARGRTSRPTRRQQQRSHTYASLLTRSAVCCGIGNAMLARCCNHRSSFQDALRTAKAHCGLTPLLTVHAWKGSSIRSRLARRSASQIAPSQIHPLVPQNVNEAGFTVGVTMSPEEAEALGLKPFGDGGAENSTMVAPKFYTHGPCATAAASDYVVRCHQWRSAGEKLQSKLAAEAVSRLRSHGFVVLDSLYPPEDILPLEREAAWFLDTPQDGFIPQPLRAGRTEGHLPFAVPWASDHLLKNSLIFEIVSHYMYNNLAAGRTQDEQQWGLVQWLTSGAELDWFKNPEWGPKPGALLEKPPAGCSDVGTAHETGPFFGRISLIKTPPGSALQKHHRDINFPGPLAQVTVQVALTPLVANNGPLAYVPGSHRMITPGYEIVANPPLGSVVLYDSFCEHHGIANHCSRDRYAMYYEFETRGVFSGYTSSHFGPQSGYHMMAFRAFVDTELRQWVNHIQGS